jgi:hypothetical protein
MNIIPNRAAPSKTPTRPHDPDVCGLGGAAECDACRAARLRDDRDFYERDAEAKKRARRRDIERRIFAAMGITVDELADALLPKLAEGMGEIAGAVMDERGAA